MPKLYPIQKKLIDVQIDAWVQNNLDRIFEEASAQAKDREEYALECKYEREKEFI